MNITHIRLLGPLAVSVDGTDIPLTGRQLRTIFTLLAASSGSTVTTDAIMASLWPENPPARARKTVHVYISNLRKAFPGESPILSVPDGYSLATDSVVVDTHRFDALVREAAATDEHEEISLLSEAIDLWHGPPFADLDIDVLRAEAVRLEEARIVAIERRIEVRLSLGYHAEVVGELEALAIEHPYRERIRAQQMLALYRSGRQADALRVYTRTRDVLAEDLGLEPGFELKQLEQDVLTQSPDLDLLAPPTETERSVTFLVTDLEDGSRLWEAEPESMTAATGLHDEILHVAVVEAGGHVFKGTGDGVLAAMPNVAAAVSAATAAQTRLASANWPGMTLRVRMAIDAGDVEYRNGDYFGPALNRACRIMSSGHGGQVLLTEQAASRADDLDVVDLGEHDFAGVGRIVVKQLATSESPASFPPLNIDRSTDIGTFSGFDHTIRGYEIRERLGEGDYGIVYRAYQASVGREVAIKVIRPEYANRPSFIRRFEVEAQVVAQIEHPHVVSLFDYWRDPDGAYLVMRWLRGGNLRSTLGNGPLRPPAAKRLLDQVGSALASAHRRGVVHRDIKPANVLLDDEGNAYLSDFGVAARHVGSDGGPLSTSPAYVSPEEVAGNGSSNVSDLYSLGMLAFEVLTGLHPEPAQPLPPVSELRPEFSPVIDQVLAKATAVNPDDRYRRVEDFLRAIRQALGADVVATQEDAEPDTEVRNPYRGLQAFQETDAEDFFGREALIDELVDAVGAKRLVAVVGPSGSGKSSVVRAGLLPRLRAEDSANPWFITDMYPGSYPFEELEGALARVSVDRLDGVSDELRSDELGLTRVLKRVLPHDDSRLLLVIDQFEELFSLTHDHDARELFLASLVAAADDARGRLHVVITMRADFFHQPLGHGDFGGLVRDGLVAVAMPTRDSLALAVSRPARGVGLDLEPGLVNEVVRDVADEPGGLPLMQHALTELFHLRRGRTLTMEDYRTSGGVLGALTRRADEIYGGLSDVGCTAAQQVFLRLVRADESAEDTRRRVRLSELYALGLDRSTVDGVLHDFGQFRLLTFDKDPITRGPTVEVGHEALIREWGLLRGWVDERREDLLLERRLETATAEWMESGQDDAFLLRGGRLAQFTQFADTTDVRLTSDESAFLDGSADAAEREAARSSRRRRMLIGVLAAFALVASTLAVFALSQRNDALDATDRAEQEAMDAREQRVVAETRGLEARTRELAALASAAIVDDPELAIHLALEAVATEELIDTEFGEVTSALYNSSFADRLVQRLQFDRGPGFFFVQDGIHQINPAATQGMQATAETDSFGLFPTTVEIVSLSDGEVLGSIEDPSGFSDFEWDPVTGEILTLGLSGLLTWRDAETFEVARTMQVEEGSMFLERVDNLLTYGALTNVEVFDLQTHVIDAETGEKIFVGPPDAFISHLSPSGELVAILDDSLFIRIFDIATGEAVNVIEVEGVVPMGWGWSAMRDEIVHGIEPGFMNVVDARSGEVLSAAEPGIFFLTYSASPDGRMFAVTGLANNVVLLDAASLEQVDQLRLRDQPTNTVWSSDSGTLVSSNIDGSSTVWDLGEVTTSSRSIPRIADGLVRIEFLADEQLLVARPGGGGDLVDTQSGEVTRTIPPRDNSATIPLATFIRSNNGGEILAVSQTEASVALVDVADATTRAVTTTDHHQAMTMSDDGKLLFTGASSIMEDSRVTGGGYAVHDTETGDVVYSSTGDEGEHEWVGAATFAPNGDLIAQVGRAGVDVNRALLDSNAVQNLMVVHDGTDGTVLLEFPLDFELIDIKVSSDGRFMAGLDYQGMLRLYDMEALRSGDGRNAVFATADVGLFTIAISPDDSMVISGGNGAVTARLVEEQLRELWSIETGEGVTGTVTIDDGHVWTTVPERLAQDREANVGLVGFPLDRGELERFAESKLSRDMTNEECRQFLALDSCAERIYRSGGS